MLKLHNRLATRWDADSIIARVTTNPNMPAPLRDKHALLLKNGQAGSHDGFACTCVLSDGSQRSGSQEGTLHLPTEFSYLKDGDILRVDPRLGSLRVLYRKDSRFNYIFFTERCNSYCVMCSQPPREVNDEQKLRDYLRVIPLMEESTEQLGITGGEPTLYPELLLEILQGCKSFLPDTRILALSNGRNFSYLSLAQAVQSVGHPDLTFGIPLYSDIAHLHDFVVQAKGAYDQTIRGIMNLERCGQKVQVRVVLHRHTVDRLPHLARFIGRNLPYVKHVALMGLEMMGFTKMNLEALWIDPVDYQDQLEEAVRELSSAGMDVSIFNHQMCVLPECIRKYAVQSISDWKNEYLPICDQCSVKSECGGFFSSGTSQVSRGVAPVSV